MDERNVETRPGDAERPHESYVDDPGSGKLCLLCRSASATDERRQSRPKPFGSSTA
jgi:hypothetical protein